MGLTEKIDHGELIFETTAFDEKGLSPLIEFVVPLLSPGTIVALVGDLGTGKTTTVRAICAALGIPARVVRSPSYTLVNEYEGRLPVYHIDLYRTPDTVELYGLGIDELLGGDGVCFIEWPDNILSSLASCCDQLLTVLFEFGEGPDERRIKVFRQIS